MKARLISSEKAKKIFNDLIVNEPSVDSRFLFCREGLFTKGLITFYIKNNQAYIENIISKCRLEFSSWVWKCLIESLLINMDELNITNINIVTRKKNLPFEEMLEEWHFVKDKEENDITTFVYQK